MMNDEWWTSPSIALSTITLHYCISSPFSYTGFDDGEFDSDFDGEEQSYLPQYDEIRRKQKSFTLTENGIADEDLKKSKMNARQQQQASPLNTLSSLTRAGVGVGGPGLSGQSSAGPLSLGSLLAGLEEEKKATEMAENVGVEENVQFKKKRKRVRKVRKSVSTWWDNAVVELVMEYKQVMSMIRFLLITSISISYYS